MTLHGHRIDGQRIDGGTASRLGAWLGFALTLLGGLGIAFVCRWGVATLLLADLAVLPENIRKRAWSQVGLFAALAVLNVFTLIKWTVEGVG